MESHQHLLVFSESCRLSTPHSRKTWQALRDSHPPGRFWRPTRPLGHLGPMVPEAGSAPAPVPQSRDHALVVTPLGREWPAIRSLVRGEDEGPPSPSLWRASFASAALRRRMVEQDGYAPSPPHCKCSVLLLALQPQSGHDGGTCTREPQLCRLVPWLLGHVVKNRTAAQVTRHEKTSLTSVLNDRG